MTRKIFVQKKKKRKNASKNSASPSLTLWLRQDWLFTDQKY